MRCSMERPDRSVAPPRPLVGCPNDATSTREFPSGTDWVCADCARIIDAANAATLASSTKETT